MKKRVTAFALILTMLWSSGLDTFSGFYGAYAETAPQETAEEPFDPVSEALSAPSEQDDTEMPEPGETEDYISFPAGTSEQDGTEIPATGETAEDAVLPAPETVAEPAEPAANAEISSPAAEPVEPVTNAETSAPAAEPVEPVTNAETSAPAAEPDQAVAAANTESAALPENTEPSTSTANTEPAVVPENTETTVLTENTESTFLTADTETVTQTEKNEPAPTENNEPASTAEAELSASTENTEGAFLAEKIETANQTEAIEPAATAECSEQTESTESTEPVFPTANTEPAGLSENTEPVASAEDNGSSASTEDTGPVSAETDDIEMPVSTGDTEGMASTEETAFKSITEEREDSQGSDGTEQDQKNSQGSDMTEQVQEDSMSPDGTQQDQENSQTPDEPVQVQEDAQAPEGTEQGEEDSLFSDEPLQTEQTEEQSTEPALGEMRTLSSGTELISREPAMAMLSAPALNAVTLRGGILPGGTLSTDSSLQKKINDAIAAAVADGDSLAKVVLHRSTVYDGDVTVESDNANITLELETEDAGEDGLQADGTASFVGTLLSSINMIIKGLNLPGMVTIQNATLDYFGSTADDEVHVTIEGDATANIQTGEGNDTITVTGEEPGTTQTGTLQIDAGEGRDSVSLEGQFKVKEAVVQGETVQVDAAVDAESVRIEAVADSESQNFSDNVASVSIGKDAVITTSGDILIDAKAEQTKSFRDNQDGLQANLVMAKAAVDIEGKLYAGQVAVAGQNANFGQDEGSDQGDRSDQGDGSGQTPTETQGSVTITAETKIKSGYQSDGTEEAGLPAAITLGTGSSVINIAKNSVIQATEMIRVEAQSDIDIITHADSNNSGANPFTAAETAVTGEVKTFADGQLTAGKDIDILSSGTLDVRTIADNADAGKDQSGTYAGLSVIQHTVEAELGNHAQATAGGNLNLKSTSQRTVETRVEDNKDSAAQSNTESDAYTLLEQTWQAVKGRFDQQDQDLLTEAIAGAGGAFPGGAGASAMTKPEFVTRAEIPSREKTPDTNGTGDNPADGIPVNVTGAIKVTAEDNSVLKNTATAYEGTAFAQADGSSAVEAIIGRPAGDAAGESTTDSHQPGVKAGSLEVSASSNHTETITSTAGKKQKSSGNDAWDASAAVNLLAHTVAAEADENSGITISKNQTGSSTTDGSLKVEAKEESKTLIRADGDTAIGATVSLNQASSDIRAKAGSTDAAGTVSVAANSHYEDQIIAKATKAGADSNRPNVSMTGDGLPVSKIVLNSLNDLLGNDETYNAISGPEGTFWSEIKSAAGEDGSATGGDAVKAIDSTGSYVKNYLLTAMLPQTAAAVGMARADHTAQAAMTGQIKSGSDISVSAISDGNTETIVDATTITDPTKNPVTGAAAITQSVNKATAEIHGNLDGKNIAISATDKSRLAGQSKANGQDRDKGASSSTIISGNTVTASVDKDVRITGTSLTITAEMQKKSEDVYQNALANADLIQISTIKDQDGLYSGKTNELTVNLDSVDIQDQFASYQTNAAGQNYYAEAISGTNGTKNAETAAAIVSKNVIEAFLGDNVLVTLTDGGNMDMHATDEAATRIVSISEYAADSRSASTILINKDSATAKTGEGTKIEAAGSVSQQAGISGETQLFNEAADNDESTSAVSRTLNLLINDTRAESIVGKADENAKETVINSDSVRIHSGTTLDLLSLSLNDVRQPSGIGAAGITANFIRDGSQANTGIGSNVNLTGKQSAQITSEVTNTLTSAAASRATALTGLPGAMNLIHNASAARTSAGGNISITSKQDSVNVGAHSNSRLLNATTSQKDKDGIVSLGGSYNINLLNSTATVDLQSGTLSARKNVSVLASGNQKSQLAGLTAAAGGEGFDFDSSVIRQKENNTIGIGVEKGISIDAGYNAALDSHYNNETLAATGSVALSAAGFIPLSNLLSAVGKAEITVDRANTVATNLGESTVTSWNNGAGQNDLVLRDGVKVTGVHVGAGADESDKLAGAGVARSIIAGMTGAAVTVRTRNTIKAETSGANLIALRDSAEKTLEFRDLNGRTVKTQNYTLSERRQLEADALEWLDMGLPLYVRVIPTSQALIRVNSIPEIYNLGDGGTSVFVKASEHSTELMLAGGTNFGFATGIGANVLVRHAENTVEAAAGDISAYGEVHVSAENRDELTQLNVNTGAGQTAAEIGATVNDLNSKVNAGVSGTVNSFINRDNPGISITAQNDATVKSTAVALAGANEFALTPVFAFTGFNGETNATVKTGSDLLSGKGITVAANSMKTVNQYTTGAAFAGGTALSGAVSVTTVKDGTHARVEKDTNILAGSMSINAQSGHTSRASSAALACSGDAAVSVNGIVDLVKSNTLAETEGKARLDDSVSVKAASKRDVINEALGFDVSGQYAGAITVMVLSAGDKMDQDAAEQLIYGSSKKENEQALNLPALGERLDKMGIRDSGSAELADDLGGDGKKIDTKKLGSMKSAGYGFDASSGYKASDTSDNDAENIKETADVENARTVGDTDYTDAATDYVNARIGSSAVIQAGKINVYAEEATLADLFGAAVSVAGELSGGISFTSAKLRSNVFAESIGTVDAREGEMSVNAVSKTGEPTSKTDSAARKQMNDALRGKLESNLISTDRSIRTIGLAVGLGGIAGFAVSGGVVRLDDNTQATIGGTVKNAGRIFVQGDMQYENVVAATIAIAGGGAMAVSASVAAAAAEGSLKATVDRNADLSGKNLTVNVLTNSTVKVYAASTTAAASAGGTMIAGLALANNRLCQDTTVERGAAISGADEQPGDLTVKGFSETVADAFLMGLNVGSVAVGMGVALAKVKPTLNTTVGVTGGDKDSTALNHLHSVNILNEVNSNALADVLTASVGAANINANVLLVYNDTKATAKAAAVQGDTEYLTIKGKLDAIGISRASADIVSGVSVGVAVNHTGLNSKNDVILETDNLKLKISKELTVIAGEDLGEDKDLISWNTQAIAHSVAAGISALNASVNTAVARNNSQNNAQITGSNLTTGKVNLYSYSNGRADAMVKGFSISFANVSVSVVMALNETTSRSYMDLSGKLNGSMNALSDVKGETNASLYTGTGALLGTVATNVATAKGRTASIANVHIGTGITSGSHSYIVRSTGRDHVETLIENLEAGTDGVLSVGTMVGRAFSRDVYDAELYLSGGKYKLKDISVTTDYTTSVKATTTPSTSGVDVNLAAVAVNKATAKNMSYAMSRLQTQGNPEADRVTTVEAEENVNVKTTGSAEANAAVNPAEFTVSLGLGIGANQARADVTGTQAAILELGYGGIGKARLVDVQSIVQKADALASVGGNGTKDKSRIRISGISAEVNSATANESLASTATVMGGVTGYDTIQGTVDYGHWEKTWEGIIDYDTPVEPETIYNWGEYLWEGKLKSGFAQMYRFLDPETGEMMYNAFSTKERDEIKKYYDKNGIKYKLDSWTTNIIQEEDGNMYLAYFDWVDIWVSEPVPAEVKVNLYNPAKNILKADALNIYAGMADGKTSKAEAGSNGAKSFSIVTAGNLKAEAYTGESISAMLEGVTATITGDANLKASSNPKAIATGYEPGGWGVAGGTSSHAKSGVGTQDEKETVTVVIGTGATLKAANVNLTAVNSGEAVSSIEGEKNVTLLAGISKGSQPTESWYDTLITVGSNAKVEATAGNVNLISVDSPTARSELVSSGFSVGVNYNSMKGENEVHQENNIDIVDGASVIAEKDVRIEAWQSTKATASSDYDGTGIVVASNTVSAVNTIRRVARANIGENTTVRAKNGNTIILAMDGIEDAGRSLLKGKHDDISTYARVSSSGFVGLANAKATTNLTGVAEIIVNAGAAIYGGNNVKMQTLSSSFAGSVKFADDMMTSETSWEKPIAGVMLGYTAGIRTYAESKGAAAIPLPNAVAKANLDFNTFISINRGNVNGLARVEYNPRTGEYETVYPAGYKKAVSLRAGNGKLFIDASNDRLYVKVGAESEGKGAAGVSNATGQIDVMLTNAVWIDNASLSGNTNLQIYADNGSDRPGNEVNSKWDRLGVCFEAATKSKLKSAGKAKSNTRITGTQINQIRSSDKGTVTFWRGDTWISGDKVVHKAPDPTGSVYQNLKADASVPKILGIKLGKTVKKKELNWYYFDRCDWCETGQEYDVSPTSQKTLQQRYKEAYERALLPIYDIQRMVEQIGTITRAHYNLFEDQTVVSIYVLDIQHILKKDIRLTTEKIADYKLWTNDKTDHTTYLLPNATQLHIKGGKPEFVTEILRGDALGDGQTRYISLYTAITSGAYAKPIIPIGSTGTLNFQMGILSIPSYADYELYLHEVSSEWLLKQFERGMMRRATADQDSLNNCAMENGELPKMTYDDALIPDGEKEGRLIYWLGHTPETAADTDETLVCLLVNSATDEIDACRTSVNMLAAGEAPIDVSLYIYRDAKADRTEEELYDVFFFDTPEGEMSLVKVITNTLGEDMQIPRSLQIKLRRFRVKDSAETAFCLYDQVLILCREENGQASALNGFYTAQFDSDLFESKYVLVTGLADGNLIVTVKKGQPVWGEWTGKDSSETIDGICYTLIDGIWYEVNKA